MTTVRESTGIKKILVVEDEEHLAEGLKLNLSLKGYDARVAADGVTALEKWKAWQPDLIVLDIMLPELDGLSVLRNIRLEDERLPVLILSARGDSDDKIKGFSFGVDDYLAKPFNLEEFLLRVERLLTRGTWSRGETNPYGNGISPSPKIYKFGPNSIDFEALIAHGPAGRIDLTDQEVKLLKIFIKHRGKPLSRSELLETGWGYEKGTSTRTVDNFIVRFRKYFEENPRKPVYFKSLRSVGYIFNHDPEVQG
jgi:two-component system, OmpR family, alkaline phosphatase synthesis response regulator PhoP